MPLHVARLRDSDLASEVDPEAAWYAVLLWAASWHQLPAASLPDNDTVLTKLMGLGRDARTFKKHRDGALRGFVKCSDGRLYHPVVAEQALVAWNSKLEQRWRTECARIKKANQRNGTSLPMPTLEQFLAGVSPEPVPGDIEGDVPGDGADRPSGHRIQETETGRPSSVPDGTGAGAPLSAMPQFEGKDPKAKAWAVAKHLLAERGGLSAARSGEVVGKLMRDFPLDSADLISIADACWATRSEAPVPYLTKAAQEVIARRRAPGGLIDAPSERQQVSWMEDLKANEFSWRPERGPRPGQDGCRVSAEIQRRYGFEPSPQLAGAAA
jgi:hypothetical protein